jgi:Clp amino terminal domain, pathogenicity island component
VNDLPTVDGLAARIDAEVPGSPLDRLSAAVTIAEDLRQLGDGVVDRYVQAARADQRSWSQIGEVLGVSKQAAQQRFVTQPVRTAPWPGLSEAASGVVTRAAEEARLLRHRYLGTEHLLLALARDGGLAGSTLKRVGVSSEGVTEQIHRIIGPGHSADDATLGITPRTKRVLEAARKEARRLGHRCADTEHLLLAVCESGGVAQQILQAAGTHEGDVRAQLAMLVEKEAPEVAAKLRAPTRRRRLRSRR